MPFFIRMRRRVRNWISKNPNLYLTVSRLTKGDFVVRPDTDVVVEGFPRSGNSFAEAALRVAANRPIKMAHHCHAAPQLHGAAQWGIPALVIIREPLDACRSLVMHNPKLFDAADALTEYCSFHEGIMSVRDAFVLADFKTVTGNFKAVLEKMDQRFDTDFNERSSFEVKSEAVFKKLDETSLERGRVDSAGEPYSPKRSDSEKSQRENEKNRVRKTFKDPRLQSHITRAQRIYEILQSTRDV